VQTVSDDYLKRICLLDTTASSALGFLDDNSAICLSTYLFTIHVKTPANIVGRHCGRQKRRPAVASARVIVFTLLSLQRQIYKR